MMPTVPLSLFNMTSILTEMKFKLLAMKTKEFPQHSYNIFYNLQYLQLILIKNYTKLYHKLILLSKFNRLHRQAGMNFQEYLFEQISFVMKYFALFEQ